MLLPSAQRTFERSAAGLQADPAAALRAALAGAAIAGAADVRRSAQKRAEARGQAETYHFAENSAKSRPDPAILELLSHTANRR